MAKQKWKVGDVFAVQTMDDQHVLAQIVGREAEVLNSVSVAFFNIRVVDFENAKSTPLDLEHVFSIVFATRDLLDSGIWQVIDHRSVAIPKSMLPHEDKRSNRFVGAKVIGSGILTKFLNAFYGFIPWDNWHNPNYLDGLLLNPSKKPDNLLYKSKE